MTFVKRQLARNDVKYSWLLKVPLLCYWNQLLCTCNYNYQVLRVTECYLTDCLRLNVLSIHLLALFLRFVVCARRSIIPTRLDLTILRITVNHFYLTASYRMYNWKENTLRIAAKKEKKETRTQKQYKENHIWTEQRLTSLRDAKFLNEDTRWMGKNIFRNSSCWSTASVFFLFSPFVVAL